MAQSHNGSPVIPWRYRPGPPVPIEHQARRRDFMVGSAAVDRWESAWGHTSDTFAPEAYGEYAATSDLIYAASAIRARNLGELPGQLWRTGRGGKPIEVTAYRPGSARELLTRVNPFWDFARLVRMIEWARCLWGQAFVVLNRGASGKQTPAEMWWVRPDRMRVVPDPNEYIRGYIYEHQGTRLAFTAGEVLWFPMDNPIDEFAGLSPLAAARLSVDTSNAAGRANRNIFTNGLMAGGVISPDDKDSTWSQSDIDLIGDLLRRRAQGDANAHRWVILSRMPKLQEASFSPQEMQYLEQLRWSVAVVARVYGVPAGLLQDREHSTYNNLDSDHRALWTDTLRPEARDIASVITEFLLPMFPGEADTFTFDLSGVEALQKSETERAELARTWWQMGVPLNDLIAEYAPNLPGGYEWGDEPGGSTAAQPEPEPEQMPDEDEMLMEEPARAALALVRQLRDAPSARSIEYGSDEHQLRWRRTVRAMDRGERELKRALVELFRRQQESVLARLRRPRMYADGAHVRAADDAAAAPFDVAQWEETFKQTVLPILTDIVVQAGQDVFDDLGILLDFAAENPLIRQWLDQSAFTFAQEVNATTIEALRVVLADGIDAGQSIDELADAVKSVFENCTDVRAELIARTETTEAVNAGAVEGARQSQVVARKVWLAALDDRTRETHQAAHGQERGVDELFEVGGSQLQFPGDGGNGADVSELANCRCTVTWVLKE